MMSSLIELCVLATDDLNVYTVCLSVGDEWSECVCVCLCVLALSYLRMCV